MRRISIDAWSLTGAKNGSSYYPKRKKSPWYLSRPQLLTTLLGFLAIYTWLNFGGHEILIPQDSWEYVQDASVTDIMNTTLGVGTFPCSSSSPSVPSTLQYSCFPNDLCSDILLTSARVSKDSRS